jgi:hypothetical protein
MASTPSFAATPILGSGLVHATLDTSLTAPSNITSLFTAGSSGTKVEEIVFQGVGTTVAGVVNVFAYDGSAGGTYHLIDQVLVSAVTSSTTAVAFRAVRQYTNLVLPSSSWSLRVTNTVSGNQALIKVSAFGASL